MVLLARRATQDAVLCRQEPLQLVHERRLEREHPTPAVLRRRRTQRQAASRDVEVGPRDLAGLAPPSPGLQQEAEQRPLGDPLASLAGRVRVPPRSATDGADGSVALRSGLVRGVGGLQEGDRLLLGQRPPGSLLMCAACRQPYIPPTPSMSALALKKMAGICN